MPKTVNIKKSAAAQAQSIRAVANALKNSEPGNWMIVQKPLGNGYFLLRNHRGESVRGTPRGLFTRGNMPILMGNIVLVQGNPKMGVEIIGSIESRREAQKYADQGLIPREVLISDGNDMNAEDDFFEASAQDEEAGADDKRGTSEATRAIASRTAAILAGGGRHTKPADNDEDVDIDDI